MLTVAGLLGELVHRRLQGEYADGSPGVIGQFLAQRDFPLIAEELIEGTRDRFTPPESSHPLSEEQDLALQAEVLAELDNDVLVRRASELQGELFQLRDDFRYSQRWFTEPELPSPESADFAETVAEALSEVERVGCRVVIELPDSSVPAVIQTTWVRNFEGAGVTPTTIASNVAECLAFKNAVRIVRAAQGSAPERI
jgi:hypothetical protein